MTSVRPAPAWNRAPPFPPFAVNQINQSGRLTNERHECNGHFALGSGGPVSELLTLRYWPWRARRYQALEPRCGRSQREAICSLMQCDASMIRKPGSSNAAQHAKHAPVPATLFSKRTLVNSPRFMLTA